MCRDVVGELVDGFGEGFEVVSAGEDFLVGLLRERRSEADPDLAEPRVA